MPINFEDEVKLFMVFDILGDTLRSGPLQWCVKRERLEDVKNHILDLILIYKIIKKYLPDKLDSEKIIDYIICHDLPEAITGDITKFQGVSQEEIDRVTQSAIDYLVSRFNGVMDLRSILSRFEDKEDIEAKVVTLIDKVHSATTFLKYQTESEIDIDDPGIIPELAPYVNMAKDQGIDVGDIFYNYHSKSLKITDDECIKYGISFQERDTIVNAVRGFIGEFYKQKLDKTLLDVSSTFPAEAIIYKRS
ncbi:MAG: HD domain-containing protein [Erysipelotrichales bacterium]|nr:HD domain-containing protein [Erysipelotrichales bacterium]